MPELTIDGQDVEVEEGTTILQAAEAIGKDIPVFCYHPGLPPDGNCRMCVVDVEDTPGQPPSCITECQDDMVVHTENDAAKDAREGVLEFLLLNHPLDCPICDKSGECMLQDHYFDFSAERSRMVEPKVKKRKVVDVGPHIVLDTERCILCTRCIRFVEHISEQPSLGIVNRGDRAELTTFPGQELDDPYSLNTCDICPVGALTSKEFRFEQRVWFLDKTSSVCPNCSKGCNIRLDHKDGEIHRMMPRHNPHVNDFWLCDEGRLCHDWVTDDSRLETVLRVDGGEQQATDRAAVEDELLPSLRDARDDGAAVAGLLSTRGTNEENYRFARFLSSTFDTDLISFLPGKKGWLEELTEDDILRNEDKNPNRKGCELLVRELELIDPGAWLTEMRDEDPEVLFLLDPMPMVHLEDGAASDVETFLEQIPLVIQIGTHADRVPAGVDWVLPGCAWAEKEGTFTSAEGRVQHFDAALRPPGDSRPQVTILHELHEKLTADESSPPGETPEDIFRTWAGEIIDQEGWDYETLGEHGRTVDGEEDPDIGPDVKLIEDATPAIRNV